MTETALVLLDFVNDIVHPDGKLAGGYSAFIERNTVSKAVRGLLSHCRSTGNLIVHVRVGFEHTYIDLPSKSPFFGAAKQYGALDSSTWGFEIADFAAPQDQELVLRKRRVSAFCATSLDLVLRNQGVKTILLAGCATDLTVQSTAREAHDRDYEVVVVEDCCAAANDSDHSSTIKLLQKVAKIVSSDDLIK